MAQSIKGFPVAWGPGYFDRILPKPTILTAEKVLVDIGGVPVLKSEITLADVDVPPGAIQLCSIFRNSNYSRVRGSETLPANTFVLAGNNLEPAYYVQVRWKSALGLGPLSDPFIMGQSGQVLAFTADPYLILDPTFGLREGRTLTMYPGSYTGATGNSLALMTMANATDNPATSAVVVPDFNFNETLVPPGLAGRWAVGRSAITDGISTIYAYTEPVQIGSEAPPEITLDPGDVRMELLHPLGAGLYQMVFWINPTKVDASKHTTWDSTGATDVRVRALFTHLTTPIGTAINNAQPVVPGNYIGLNAPLLTTINAGYTGAAGYWRIEESPAQTAGNIGTQWVSSWGLDEDRVSDTQSPRRVVRFQVSLNGGVTWGPITTFNFAPVIPSLPAPTGEYWKYMERTEGMRTSSDPNNYGFGFQYLRGMMGCEANPDFIIGGGDMNYLRLSDTGGRSWYTPQCDGLRTPAFNSVAVDPEDENYLVAAGSLAWWGVITSPANLGTLTGLYNSRDKGKTWRLAQQMTLASSGDEYKNQLMTYDPAPVAGPASRRLYFMQQIRPQRATATGQQLWVSNDGGQSWAKLGPQFAASQFVSMHQLRAHPTNNTLYLCAQNGLWVSNTAKTAWTRVAQNLPASRCMNVEISPNGTELYAFMWNGAAWRCTSVGGNWTSIYSANAVHQGAVNWKDSPETVYIQLNRDSAPHMVVNRSGNGTGAWTVPSVSGMVGWPVNDTYHAKLATGSTSSVGFQSILALHKPGACVVHAVSRMFTTDDVGFTFKDGCKGFTGLNHDAWTPSVVIERRDNPEIGMMPLQDTSIAITFNGWRSCVTRQINNPADPRVFGFGQYPESSYCGDWSPPDISRPDGRIMLGWGDAGQQGFLYSDNLGVSWTAVTSVTWGGVLRFIGKHPNNNSVVAGNRISRNLGDTFSITIPGSALGLSKSGVLYATRGANEIWRSTNWHTATTTAEVTWTPFYSGASMNKPALQGQIARVSIAEENTVWVRGTGRDLHRVKNNGTTTATQSVVRFGIAGRVPDIPLGNFFELADISPDANDPNMVYVTLFGSGYEHVWRGRLTGQTTDAITWQNITKNAYKWQNCSVNVRPSTGETIVGGALGPIMFPAPSGYKTQWGLSNNPSWQDLAVPVNLAQLLAA